MLDESLCKWIWSGCTGIYHDRELLILLGRVLAIQIVAYVLVVLVMVYTQKS